MSPLQYGIYPNPGGKKQDIPFLVVIQNNHISSRTGASVVIPLRANVPAIEIMNPWVDVPGHGSLVLSADEIFAIDNSRLRNLVGSLGCEDRMKIRPAIDLVIGDY
jgi:mRNA-degrading endonuclease toxin of MazEF toxin-antitoxin module